MTYRLIPYSQRSACRRCHLHLRETGSQICLEIYTVLPLHFRRHWVVGSGMCFGPVQLDYTYMWFSSHSACFYHILSFGKNSPVLSRRCHSRMVVGSDPAFGDFKVLSTWKARMLQDYGGYAYPPPSMHFFVVRSSEPYTPKWLRSH